MYECMYLLCASGWACMYISAGPRSSESPATPLNDQGDIKHLH